MLQSHDFNHHELESDPELEIKNNFRHPKLESYSGFGSDTELDSYP